MHVTLDIPDETAAGRAALEAYRQRRLSIYQLGNLLGLPSRWDLHALLKGRQIDMCTLAVSKRIWSPTRS